MLTQILTECPEPDCDWGSFHYYPEPFLNTHLIERHGYSDTTAHVLAAEAVSPVSDEDSSEITCRHCDAPIAIHDDDAWDEWTCTFGRGEGGTGSYCDANTRNHNHEPRG
ncbi:MAG: hypothetical protein LC721_08640 [Actinobacteria bacterium]|nr:hypothetical protein [Actinomycetota bacterium]